MESARIKLKELELTDAAFVFEIVNTKEWVQNIGDRNIKTINDACAYIQKIIDNPNITYWIIYLANEEIKVGIISLVKRDYLQYPDIGFALLPAYTGKGYAVEGAKLVLNSLIENKTYPVITGVTLKENTKSIKLLEKLGLKFEKEIHVNDEFLLLYSILLY